MDDKRAKKKKNCWNANEGKMCAEEPWYDNWKNSVLPYSKEVDDKDVEDFQNLGDILKIKILSVVRFGQGSAGLHQVQ